MPTRDHAARARPENPVSILGVLAPAGTPGEVVERLNAAVATFVAMPEVRGRFPSQVVCAAAPATPEPSAERIAEEVARPARVIADAGIGADG